MGFLLRKIQLICSKKYWIKNNQANGTAENKQKPMAWKMRVASLILHTPVKGHT